MRIPATIALFSVLAVLGWGPAWGQTPVTTVPNAPPASPAQMDLPTFVKTPEHVAALVKTAKEQMKQAGNACAAGTFQPTNQLAVLEQVRFSNGKPTSGAWSQRVEASGCGPVHTLNVLSVVRPDGSLQVVGMMPGDTHTDPMMQKNALQYAQAIAVRAAPSGCKQLAFVDTKFDGFIGLPSPEVTDGREARPWREIWTLTACGNLFDVNLVFTPNARGTGLAGSNPVKHAG